MPGGHIIGGRAIPTTMALWALYSEISFIGSFRRNLATSPNPNNSPFLNELNIILGRNVLKLGRLGEKINVALYRDI